MRKKGDYRVVLKLNNMVLEKCLLLNDLASPSRCPVLQITERDTTYCSKTSQHGAYKETVHLMTN